MAPTASPHKRKVVKHRTNAAEAGGRAAHHATGGGGRRSGFQVGPKHAPDGSYLGRGEWQRAQRVLRDALCRRPLTTLRPQPRRSRAG